MIYTANRTHHPPKHALNLTYFQTNTYLNHNWKNHDESSTILDTTDTEE